MAFKVEKVELWHVCVEDKPGALAGALKPLAEAGANLTVVGAYPTPDKPGSARVFVTPIKGRKVIAAAKAAGYSPSEIPTLRVEGPDRPGLGHYITSAIAAKGINLAFAYAAVVGTSFVVFLGFHSTGDANKAARIIAAL